MQQQHLDPDKARAYVEKVDNSGRSGRVPVWRRLETTLNFTTWS